MFRARTALAAAAAMCVSLTLAGPASAADKDKQSLVDRIVAKADPKLMQVLITSKGAHGRPEFNTINVPDIAAAKRVVSDMLGKPGVQSVEMNRPVKALGWNDPYFPQQWALDSSHFYMDKIWQITKNDTTRPYVAVVDTGIQGNHPDLATHMSSGYEFHETGLLGGGDIAGSATSKSTSNDGCGHGTHVAGIIAAGGNNEMGVVGMAQRAVIRSVKVLGSDCSGSDATVAAGITWAADHAHIINLSLGSPDPSDAEQSAIDYALFTKKRVVIAAAGNHSGSSDNVRNYPAAYYGVLGVGAVDSGWHLASFSNTGGHVDLAAPGVGIASTLPTDTYGYEDGTSMATPYVAAAAVLAMQHCHYWASKVMSKLQTTASNYPRKYTTIGYGVIRPLSLLRCQ